MSHVPSEFFKDMLVSRVWSAVRALTPQKISSEGDSGSSVKRGSRITANRVSSPVPLPISLSAEDSSQTHDHDECIEEGKAAAAVVHEAVSPTGPGRKTDSCFGVETSQDEIHAACENKQTSSELPEDSVKIPETVAVERTVLKLPKQRLCDHIMPRITPGVETEPKVVANAAALSISQETLSKSRKAVAGTSLNREAVQDVMSDPQSVTLSKHQRNRSRSTKTRAKQARHIMLDSETASHHRIGRRSPPVTRSRAKELPPPDVLHDDNDDLQEPNRANRTCFAMSESETTSTRRDSPRLPRVAHLDTRDDATGNTCDDRKEKITGNWISDETLLTQIVDVVPERKDVIEKRNPPRSPLLVHSNERHGCTGKESCEGLQNRITCTTNTRDESSSSSLKRAGSQQLSDAMPAPKLPTEQRDVASDSHSKTDKGKNSADASDLRTWSSESTSEVSIELPSNQRNSNLFTLRGPRDVSASAMVNEDTNGCPVLPMQFYIGLTKLDRDELIRDITLNGGRVVSKPGGNNDLRSIFPLVDPQSRVKPGGRTAYSDEFIHACIDSGMLLNPEDFRLGRHIPVCESQQVRGDHCKRNMASEDVKYQSISRNVNDSEDDAASTSSPKKISHQVHMKRVRQAFDKGDDRIMMEFALKCIAKRAFGYSSRRLWEEAARRNILGRNVTAESMRQRIIRKFGKSIAPAIELDRENFKRIRASPFHSDLAISRPGTVARLLSTASPQAARSSDSLLEQAQSTEDGDIERGTAHDFPRTSVLLERIFNDSSTSCLVSSSENTMAAVTDGARRQNIRRPNKKRQRGSQVQKTGRKHRQLDKQLNGSESRRNPDTLPRVNNKDANRNNNTSTATSRRQLCNINTGDVSVTMSEDADHMDFLYDQWRNDEACKFFDDMNVLDNDLRRRPRPNGVHTGRAVKSNYIYSEAMRDPERRLRGGHACESNFQTVNSTEVSGDTDRIAKRRKLSKCIKQPTAQSNGLPADVLRKAVRNLSREAHVSERRAFLALREADGSYKVASAVLRDM